MFINETNRSNFSLLKSETTETNWNVCETSWNQFKPVPSFPSFLLLLLLSLTDATVINSRVAPLGGAQQQRAVGCSRDFIWTDTGTELHVRAARGPDGQKQLRTLSCRHPVPAEGGGDGWEGGVGGVQQGALQGGILPDSHLHSGGQQGAARCSPHKPLKQHSEITIHLILTSNMSAQLHNREQEVEILHSADEILHHNKNIKMIISQIHDQ